MRRTHAFAVAAAALACGAAALRRPLLSPAPDAVPAGAPIAPASNAPEPAPTEAPPPTAAPSPPPPPDKSAPPWSQTRIPPIGIGEVVRGTAAGGRHLRIGTPSGAVHAWEPPGYARGTAATVIYLHGYYTDADQAWLDHRLAEQFRASRRNALFIVAESPSWVGEDLWWPDLGRLLDAVTRAGVRLPSGPIVVAGHSGAFRTILAWLADPRLREVVLLDGLYRSEDAFDAWLAGAAPGARRLVLVGQETAARTEAWLADHPDAVRRDAVPARAPRRGDPARTAPLVYYRSQLDHMALVTSGRVLPMLLEASAIPATR
jgi:hypothetical protein